jgi:Lipid A 3-O-deacylase (PagL)
LFNNRLYTFTKWVLSSSIIFFAKNLMAQDTYGLAFTYGKILKHTSKLTYNPPAASYNAEVNYTHQTNGSKAWHHLYNKPIVGISVTLNNYCDSVIGSSITAMPHLQLKILGNKKIFGFVRLGTGPALATKHWQQIPITDTINNYLGTTINMYANILLGVQWQINKNWQCKFGYALSHVSNGAIRKPNLGINLFGAYVAANYCVYNKNANTTKYQNYQKPKRTFKWGLDVRGALSAQEYGTGDGPLLPVYYAGMFITNTLWGKHKLLAGIDYEFNKKTAFFVRHTYQKSTNTYLESGSISAVIGNEFLLGHFSIPVQIGYYLNSPYLKSNAYYQRFGVFYYPYQSPNRFFKKMYIGTTLKSNAATADYIDGVLGFSF